MKTKEQWQTAFKVLFFLSILWLGKVARQEQQSLLKAQQQKTAATRPVPAPEAPDGFTEVTARLPLHTPEAN